MTSHIEGAVREAVEKGKYKRFGVSRAGYVHLIYTDDEKPFTYNDAFLDPLFWRALGKARGWKKACRDCHQERTEKLPKYCHCDSLPSWVDGWRIKWDCFFDHLAEGKDAESFFAAL